MRTSYHYLDITGQKFGRLTVIEQTAKVYLESGKSVRMWLCECECGVRVVRAGGNLQRQQWTPSCGCLLAEKNRARQRTHGFAGNGKEPMRPEYNSWKGIRARCTNPKVKAFKHYGGRGITMCARWSESFENFYEDMGPKPTPKHSVDRIDNNGNYDPENCRWATPHEQANNRRPVSRKIAFPKASPETEANERAESGT